MKVNLGDLPEQHRTHGFSGVLPVSRRQPCQRRWAKVTQDCGACHNLLAMEEAAPKILTELGVVESKGQK
jgi:hypothetical protein